jgi:hypothetical protein
MQADEMKRAVPFLVGTRTLKNPSIYEDHVRDFVYLIYETIHTIISTE